MLGLKLVTDPYWVKLVESNIEAVLVDHAFCEQKAATNAINLIVHYSHLPDLVQEMSKIAIEEMEHFKQVHELILERGFALGKERKDSYVNELIKFVRRGYGYEFVLIDRLLFSAMIEARSCERFRVLSQNIEDEKLAKFYNELMISEATHYTTFLKLAKKYAETIDVDARWKEFLAYEGEVIQNYGKSNEIHG